MEFPSRMSGDNLRLAKEIDIAFMQIEAFTRDPTLDLQKEAVDWANRLPTLLAQFGEAWRNDVMGMVVATLQVHLSYPEDGVTLCAWCRKGRLEVSLENQVIEYSGRRFKLIGVPQKKCTNKECGKGAFNLEVLNPLKPILDQLVRALGLNQEVSSVEIDSRVAELVTD